jgi:hypothetical protein
MRRGSRSYRRKGYERLRCDELETEAKGQEARMTEENQSSCNGLWRNIAWAWIGGKYVSPSTVQATMKAAEATRAMVKGKR